MKIAQVWTRLAQLVLAVNVLLFAGISMLILFWPQTFQSLIQFAPFNRHYLGDAGVFQLAVILGLLWALPAPTRGERISGSAPLPVLCTPPTTSMTCSLSVHRPFLPSGCPRRWHCWSWR